MNYSSTYTNSNPFKGLNSDVSNQADLIKYKFNVIMLGDAAVGKTSILNRYVKNKYNETYSCTLGVDFIAKEIKLIPNYSVSLQLMDTCGEEKFRSIAKSYYKRSNGIILVYDVTDKFTFQNLNDWYNDIKNNCSKKIVLFLVGNKIDSKDRKKFLSDEARNFCRITKAKYYEVSAKLGKNITNLFEEMAQALIDKDKEKKNYKSDGEEEDDDSEEDDKNKKNLSKPNITNKKGCCG